MAFFSTAAELTRKYKQNREDIEFLHELVEETNENVKQTNAKVDQLGSRFDRVDERFAQVDERFAQVDERFAQVDERFAHIDTRFDRIDTRFAHIDTRFDRLEQLIALPPAEREAATDDPMRTQQEKKISLLETKMEIYSRRTSDHIEELKRHNRMFDALDSQMTEVLEILRARSA